MAGMCSNQQMQLVASDLTRDGMPHSIHETSAFCVLHALPTRKVPARVRTKKWRKSVINLRKKLRMGQARYGLVRLRKVW